jgi:hypothetical protein
MTNDTRGRAYCVGFEYQAQDPDALQIVMFTHGEVPEIFPLEYAV